MSYVSVAVPSQACSSRCRSVTASITAIVAQTWNRCEQSWAVADVEPKEHTDIGLYTSGEAHNQAEQPQPGEGLDLQRCNKLRVDLRIIARTRVGVSVARARPVKPFLSNSHQVVWVLALQEAAHFLDPALHHTDPQQNKHSAFQGIKVPDTAYASAFVWASSALHLFCRQPLGMQCTS